MERCRWGRERKDEQRIGKKSFMLVQLGDLETQQTILGSVSCLGALIAGVKRLYCE